MSTNRSCSDIVMPRETICCAIYLVYNKLPSCLFTAARCGGNLVAGRTVNTITSPNYFAHKNVRHYDVGQECNWLITVGTKCESACFCYLSVLDLVFSLLTLAHWIYISEGCFYFNGLIGLVFKQIQSTKRRKKGKPECHCFEFYLNSLSQSQRLNIA